jgi:hypothetical protein
VLYADPDTTVPDLLDAVPDHQVAELVELAIRAARADVLTRLTAGISGPLFVEHWADGDLLIAPAPTGPGTSTGTSGGGGGMVLLDVKTVTSARDPDRVARWLWQLLGYAWLDPTDRYRIRSVGLYLARHVTPTSTPRPRTSGGSPTGSSPPKPANRPGGDVTLEQELPAAQPHPGR